MFELPSSWLWLGVIGFATTVLFLVWFFYRSQRIRRRAQRLARFSDYPSRFITVDPFKWHYLQEGQGPDILLIHGIGASTYAWRLLFPLLAQEYRVTAIDLPGFGRSSKDPRLKYNLDEQAERLLGFLEALDIKKCTLVGSSMGGTIALWLALKEPKRFKKVALIGPAVRPRQLLSGFKHLKYFSPLMKWGVNETMIEQIMRQVVASRELVTAENIQAYFEPYKNSPDAITTFIKALDAVTDKRVPHAFAPLKAEICVLWGARDRITPVIDLKVLRQIVPHLEHHIHDTGGHHLMEDDPQWVASHLHSFIKK